MLTRVLPAAKAASRAVHIRGLRTSSAALDKESEKLKDLAKLFQDPSSPFYLAPGEVGPASPDDHTVSRPLPGQDEAASGWQAPRLPHRDSVPPAPHVNPDLDRTRATAHEWFDSNGFDSQGRLEWPVAWGEQDMFRHINNVNYLRYIENARLRWIETWMTDVGEEMTADLLNGRNTGFIMKEITVRYRAPVTWPDSIIWGLKPHSIRQDRADFKLAVAGWSLKDNKLCITSDSTVVMFDYSKNKKGVMTDHVKEVLERRASA